MRHTVYWDAERRSYVVRWRRPKDVRRQVPREVFDRHGIDSQRETKRGRELAERWAREQGKRGSLAREMSLEELWRLYERRNPNEVADATMRRSAISVRSLVEILGDLAPSEIDYGAALEYREALKERGRSPRTIKNDLAFLRHLLVFAYECRRETGMGELSLLRLPKTETPKQRGRVLTRDEIDRLARVELDRDRGDVRAILLFGVATGLRKDPLLGLEWGWVDLGRKWLTVPGERMKGGRGIRSELSVPLSETAVALLEGRSREGRYVWPHPRTGKPRGDLWHTLQRMQERGRVRGFSLHDLRRTFATILFDAGAPEIVRQTLMGHATGRKVIDRYTFVSEGQLREGLRAVDEYMSHVPTMCPKGPREIP